MQPSIPWSSSVSVFVIEKMAIIRSLKCTMQFSFVYHCCHSLSLTAICCHSFLLFITRCTTPYHSLSLVFIRCTTRCHSLSLVPLVFTRCTTHLSFYKRSIETVHRHEKNHNLLNSVFSVGVWMDRVKL